MGQSLLSQTSWNGQATEMEDRSQRSNLRLVGLAESEEGSDPIGFLKTQLPPWIPSLAGAWNKNWEGKDKRPRTLNFKLLDYTDRQAILKGAFPMTHNKQPLSFFPDFCREILQHHPKIHAIQDAKESRSSLHLPDFYAISIHLYIISGDLTPGPSQCRSDSSYRWPPWQHWNHWHWTRDGFVPTSGLTTSSSQSHHQDNTTDKIIDWQKVCREVIINTQILGLALFWVGEAFALLFNESWLIVALFSGKP